MLLSQIKPSPREQKSISKLSTEIAVIGLGYVGLPLAISAIKSGFKVIGVDSNSARADSINNGISPVEDIANTEIQQAITAGMLFPTTDYNQIKECKTILICVPTPLTEAGKPNLSFLEVAIKSVSPFIRPGTLVIVESTIATGTTKSFIQPLIKSFSSLNEEDFLLAYSPERIDPTNKSWNLSNTPKLVSGINLESQIHAVTFYNSLGINTFECDSVEIAETAKLLENSFRLVNISFINELSIFCNKLNIDINKVISAAATKPYGFMPFYPSIGAGGHCIPVDPIYLANAAQAVGAPSRFIELADQINQEMPDYFVGRAEEKLGSLKAKKVLVVGVSYKPNVADVRESPVEGLISRLRQKNAHVSWHDDLVKEWNGEKSVALSSQYDLVILATPHAYLDLTKLGNVPILNTRGSI